MRTLAFVFALATLQLVASAASAQVNRNDTAFAIGGYDPVAYFTDHAAVRGDASHAFEWRGARWLFASEAHRALFAATPERYAPAYGGYCAYAASQGRLVRVDPEAWFVEGGRLFLNYSQDIRRTWLADRARFIRDADARWPELSRGAH
jgi:YHS domain-containing protein